MWVALIQSTEGLNRKKSGGRENLFSLPGFKLGRWCFFCFVLFFWSIVALQCCVSFCCMANWISYAYTYIHSFLELLPIRSPQIIEHWVEFPVLYSTFSLVTYFIHSSVCTWDAGFLLHSAWDLDCYQLSWFSGLGLGPNLYHWLSLGSSLQIADGRISLPP